MYEKLSPSFMYFRLPSFWNFLLYYDNGVVTIVAVVMKMTMMEIVKKVNETKTSSRTADQNQNFVAISATTMRKHLAEVRSEIDFIVFATCNIT